LKVLQSRFCSQQKSAEDVLTLEVSNEETHGYGSMSHLRSRRGLR
jgi:hypothetical protein